LDSGQSDLLHHVTGETGKDLEGRLADALKRPQRYAATTRSSKDGSDDDMMSMAEASIKHWWEEK
jgi:hypothetical protein